MPAQQGCRACTQRLFVQGSFQAERQLHYVEVAGSFVIQGMEQQSFLQRCQGQELPDGSVLRLQPLDLAPVECNERCIGRSESLRFGWRYVACRSEFLDCLMLEDIARCEEQAG